MWVAMRSRKNRSWLMMTAQPARSLVGSSSSRFAPLWPGRRPRGPDRAAAPPAGPSVSDRVRLHLVGDVVGLTDREGHDRQGWVLCPAGGELAAVRDEQVLDVVRL